MELALTSTHRPLLLRGFSQNLNFSDFLGRTFNTSSNIPFSRTRWVTKTIVMSQNKTRIEGISDELNKIASQNLDHAHARRRVRSAFADIQQQLDHVLFKVLLFILLFFFFLNCRS